MHSRIDLDDNFRKRYQRRSCGFPNHINDANRQRIGCGGAVQAELRQSYLSWCYLRFAPAFHYLPMAVMPTPATTVVPETDSNLEQRVRIISNKSKNLSSRC
jgi:hypothetical protein